MFRVAVLVGSIRPQSTNLQFARALEKLALGRLVFDYVEIGNLPFYDETLWANPPEAVVNLKQRIADADAVLFVTPEYNRSIPGVLKNAIDWPSRPFGQSVWDGKPAAIVGATGGQSGTAAAQAHLRSILPVLGVILMGRPEVYQTVKPGLFDEHDLITDERTRLFLGKWVDSFVGWIGRFVAPQAIRIAAE
jgi:chromate reductase, NAD(P)H dehydrogenase (quinone)